MIETKLTWGQVDLAASIGCRRYVKAMAKGRTERHGADERDGWGLHILGAMAECAAAQILDVYWPMATDPDYAGDLTGGLHVRSTERDSGSLILHENDADDGVFYLVTCSAPPVFRLQGGIVAERGKRREFWREVPEVPASAFFIPQSKLTMPTTERT